MSNAKKKFDPKFSVLLAAEIMFDDRLDVYAKMTFSYMKFRYQFFTHKGLDYCESINTIAAAVGISRTKMIKTIHLLEETGYLVKTVRNADRKAPKKEQTNIYVIKDCLPNKLSKKEVDKYVNFNDLEGCPF